MLVPIVGMSAAWFFLGETVSFGELCGAALVIIGVLGAGMRAAKGPKILAEVVPADAEDEADVDEPSPDVPAGTC